MSIYITLYLLSSLFTLLGWCVLHHLEGNDLILGDIFIILLVSLVPILNLAWIPMLCDNVVILKGKKQ